MAKKVRTPPPPRRVQAPQRRDTRGPSAFTRSPWVYVAVAAGLAALIAAVVLGVVLLRGDGDGATKANPGYNGLPGVRRTKAPWPPEYEFLADRLSALGLTTLAQEGLATHIHAHLDVFVDGRRVAVPALVGINPGAGYLTELHTHDTRGVIHVESPREDDEFTLGQFFGEWAVYLDSRCIGGYCDGLRWYVNGERQTGNPADLVLESHQEIVIVVGKPPAKIPSSFKFSAGE
jgi:hypothetical protein